MNAWIILYQQTKDMVRPLEKEVQVSKEVSPHLKTNLLGEKLNHSFKFQGNPMSIDRQTH